MQVTSDTLFHFTTSAKNLESILSKKFQLTYCKETFTLDYQSHDYFVPMVSFCDIPLSLAKNQIDKYGSYAIGMTKEWGIRNKLNPVVYIEKDSLLGIDVQVSLDDTLTLMDVIHRMITSGSAIMKILESTKYFENQNNSITKFTDKVNSIKGFKDEMEKRNAIKSLTEELNSIKAFNENLKTYKTILGEYSGSITQLNKILHDTADSKFYFFRYIKNYQGSLTRQGKINKNYRFYDEREWRYVPAISDKRVETLLNEEQYKKYRSASKMKPLIDKISLNFTSEDIKYLIVKSNKDIPKLIKSIQSIDNLTKNANDAAILTTKILTVEQLNTDF